MTFRIRTVLAICAAVLLIAPAGAAAGGDGLPYENPRLPVHKRVDDLLSRMTLEEKVGQMTQTERYQVFDDESPIATWKLGSILSGGGSTPPQNTPEAWADMVDRFQRAALNTRLGIPLIYGVDAVHGHGNLLGATVFPHNIGLGATRDPGLVKEIAEITAEETRASGPQWNFSPCICAARDDRWGRTYESFSEDPDLVIRMESAIDGYQGRDLSDTDHVLATAKHYAGDGDTEFGTGEGDYTIDQGIAVTNRSDFWENSLRQYVPAVKWHDVGSVMPSFSSVDWTEDGVGDPIKMHANRELITGVLKGAMDFDGLVISDWEGINQIPGDRATDVRTGVNAGIDMMMEPNAYQSFITTLLEEVRAGRVPMSRIDDAVSRILAKKFELGLFERPFTDRRNIDEIGSRHHHRVARDAAAKSSVLLKNRDRTLPFRLRRGQGVYVAGSNADNIGNQAGGWTITWQGNSNHVIPGTTILDGIEELARGPVTHSADASAPIRSSDVGVVVVGETPYAEGFGDVGGPRWGFDPGETELRPEKTMHLSAEDKAAVDRVCAAAKRCVVVVISGRPMIVESPQLGAIDALVAAWLPGSEGAGVADVLFGKRPFTGRLPMTWPRTLDQEPINIGDEDYDPLYPYGHGLRTRGHDDD
jgi:beta-glucosidase